MVVNKSLFNQALTSFLVAALLITLPSCGGSESNTDNPLAGNSAKNTFAGKFSGDTLAAKFEQEANGTAFNGTITHEGSTYPATAKKDGERIVGTFTANGNALPFTATMEGQTLSLESGGVTHVMTRIDDAPPANPLAKTPGSPTTKDHQAEIEPAGTTPPVNAVALKSIEMATFKHPAGFTFEHPKGWQVQATEQGIVIIPANVKKDAQGQPMEVLMIGGEDATGVSNIADQQVLQYLDQTIKQMFPAFKRVGETETLKSLLGDGMVITYEGKTPTNIDGKASVHGTLYKGSGIFLTHLGEKTLVDANQNVARRIFSSFGWTKGATDNNLVGTWKRSESESSSIDSRGYVGGTTTKTWVFATDGTVAYGIGTAIYGSTTGSGYSITIDPQQSKNISKGNWSVQENVLTVLWEEGGSNTYEYKVFPHVQNQTGLKLLIPGEKKPLYFIKQ